MEKLYNFIVRVHTPQYCKLVKVDKRTKHLPLVATAPEKERFRDHLYKLNKARTAAGKKPYSFSRYGIEAIHEKMERDTDAQG